MTYARSRATGAASRAPQRCAGLSACRTPAADGNATSCAGSNSSPHPAPDPQRPDRLDTDQTHGTAWAEHNDNERDGHLEHRGKTVRRVRRETWDRQALAAELRGRLT
jgi:hypothetical protein